MYLISKEEKTLHSNKGSISYHLKFIYCNYMLIFYYCIVLCVNTFLEVQESLELEYLMFLLVSVLKNPVTE